MVILDDIFLLIINFEVKETLLGGVWFDLFFSARLMMFEFKNNSCL
jgi:hypothetical protein